MDEHEFLTLEEIEARYAPDWVLIDQPKTDELQQLLGGCVVDRGPDREDLYRKARELGLHHIAVLKLGPLLEGLEFMLTPFVVEPCSPFEAVGSGAV